MIRTTLQIETLKDFALEQFQLAELYKHRYELLARRTC